MAAIRSRNGSSVHSFGLMRPTAAQRGEKFAFAEIVVYTLYERGPKLVYAGTGNTRAGLPLRDGPFSLAATATGGDRPRGRFPRFCDKALRGKRRKRPGGELFAKTEDSLMALRGGLLLGA